MKFGTGRWATVATGQLLPAVVSTNPHFRWPLHSGNYRSPCGNLCRAIGLSCRRRLAAWVTVPRPIAAVLCNEARSPSVFGIDQIVECSQLCIGEHVL